MMNSRNALWKNPENLTEKQQIKLAWVVHTNPALNWAYYLKEGLRLVFKLPRDEAAEALDKGEYWLRWAIDLPRISRTVGPHKMRVH